MTPGRLTIWIAAFSTVLLGAARAPIYVGVLEAPVDNARGDFHVRVAFRFEDGQWSAMPHGVADQDALAKLAAKFPRQVSWTIALQGKRLGQLSTTRPLAYSLYADVGLEDLAPSSNENAGPPVQDTSPARFKNL